MWLTCAHDRRTAQPHAQEFLAANKRADHTMIALNMQVANRLLEYETVEQCREAETQLAQGGIHMCLSTMEAASS